MKKMQPPVFCNVSSLKYSFVWFSLFLVFFGVEEAMVKPPKMFPGTGEAYRRNLCLQFMTETHVGRLSCRVLDLAMTSKCYEFSGTFSELKLEACSQDEVKIGYRDFVEEHKGYTDRQLRQWSDVVDFLFDGYAKLRDQAGGRPKEFKDGGEVEVEDGGKGDGGDDGGGEGEGVDVPSPQVRFLTLEPHDPLAQDPPEDDVDDPEEYVDDGDGPDDSPVEVRPDPQVSGEASLSPNPCLQEQRGKADCCCNDTKNTIDGGGDDDGDGDKVQVDEADGQRSGDQVGCCWWLAGEFIPRELMGLGISPPSSRRTAAGRPYSPCWSSSLSS